MPKNRPVNIKPEAVEAAREEVKAQPTKDQIVAAYGEEGLVKDGPKDGLPEGEFVYEFRTNGKIDLEKYRSYSQGMCKPMKEAKQKVAEASKGDVAVIKNARGERIEVPAHMAERAERMVYEQRRRRG